MFICIQGLNALIFKIIFPYAHAHTCIENGPGEHTSLVNKQYLFLGKGGTETAKGTSPGNFILHADYLAVEVNVTCINTRESNKIFKNFKMYMCTHTLLYQRQGNTGFDSKLQDLV